MINSIFDLSYTPTGSATHTNAAQSSLTLSVNLLVLAQCANLLQGVLEIWQQSLQETREQELIHVEKQLSLRYLEQARIQALPC